ncbi:MAG TPA: hypothetical protein VFD39_03435, partial [Trueperaceae bacterium]|nr:hypothetical protein [Trueperaceae bacterium]
LAAAPAPSQQPAAPDFLAAAAELYAWNCAVCHGETGGGLEEAKLAFPPDHRDCTRCHRPSNRVVQPLDQPFIGNDMFSIGEPPALHAGDSGEALAAVAEPAALHAYIAATMPRYDPGRLSDEEYWALTALLLHMNDREAEAAAVATGAAR